jgi:hypothetical protein
MLMILDARLVSAMNFMTQAAWEIASASGNLHAPREAAHVDLIGH